MNTITLLYVMTFVGMVLIGGVVHDQLARSARQSACERTGGAFVLGVSDFVCVAKRSEVRS